MAFRRLQGNKLSTHLSRSIAGCREVIDRTMPFGHGHTHAMITVCRRNDVWFRVHPSKSECLFCKALSSAAAGCLRYLPQRAPVAGASCDRLLLRQGSDATENLPDIVRPMRFVMGKAAVAMSRLGSPRSPDARPLAVEVRSERKVAVCRGAAVATKVLS